MSGDESAQSRYLDHLKRGPFPGHTDPWAETARYFQQIHSGMIVHLTAQLLDQFAYNIVVHLPENPPYIIGAQVGAPLKRIAISLQAEVIGAELQHAYDRACAEAFVAAHIQRECAYDRDCLAFASLLSDDERTRALAVVQAWQAESKRLSNEKS